MDSLYENMLKAISDPERFEFADEVMDNVDVKSRATFAKSVNVIAEQLDLPERVRLLKELRGTPEQRRGEQQKDFLLTLNRLFENVRGEPDLARRIVPQKWVEREQDDMIQRYQMMAEEYYGVPQPLDINPDSLITWDKTHVEFLESETMLDDLVRFGSTLIKDFEDVWRVAFLAQASCFAPGIIQGEKAHRSQIHMLIAGEYSTSKSGLVSYMAKMFPKVVRCNDTTGPGLMGSIRKDGTVIVGVAQESDRSVLVLEEFDKLMRRSGHLDGILRAILEDQYFSRRLAYGKLEYETRPSVLALANPKRDVFFSDSSLASQVPFKVGLLSRFDYIRPMAYTKEKINSIAGFIARTAFRSDCIQGVMRTQDVLRMYYAMQSSLNEHKVREVHSEEQLLMDIHERFCKLQKDVEDVPLLSVRDFMSALRVFNASAIMHHRQRRISEGIVMASDVDRDQAIYVLDNTVKSREMLMNSRRRQDVCLTPLEKAHGQLMNLIQRHGTVLKQDAVVSLQTSMGIGYSTAYKYVSAIVERDKGIHQEGLRDARLVLA